ncbi:MAG: sulfatase-like hydrolase/transferase, partial [Planctomycetota bacterium]
MNHRSQTALSLLLILASTTSAFAAERLNVLMILVDDMNDWVGCLEGHPNVKTPNIDRLAKRGMLFTNAHVAAPVCNPSRVATMTGKRPSTTGIYNNGVIWYRSYPQIESLPARFKTGGYVSAGGGKVYHHMPHFNRLTDWHEYFDQVFDSRYHDQLYSGTLDGGFRWPKGFPVNKMPEVAALGRPPSNASEFDWGPWDKADLEMGDGKLVEWAVEF